MPNGRSTRGPAGARTLPAPCTGWSINWAYGNYRQKALIFASILYKVAGVCDARCRQGLGGVCNKVANRGLGRFDIDFIGATDSLHA